jgi:single-strand DNA-binding protein
MPDFNNVLLAGRLTRDPELKVTRANAVPFTELSLAVNRSFKRDGKWSKEVSYFDIVVWKQQAELCCKYLHKGSSILVSGELEQQRWTDKSTGKGRSKITVRAMRVQFLDAKSGAPPTDAMSEGAPADGFDGGG